MFTRTINSKYLIKITHKRRIIAVVTMNVIGFTILGVSNLVHAKWGFFFALSGAIIMGIGSSLGESVNLGLIFK